MAAQVLSGTSNVSYTNNTGQNVRIVINYMRGLNDNNQFISLSWTATSGGTVTVTHNNIRAIGRNLAYASSDGAHGQNMVGNNSASFPTEIMIAPGHTFSATCLAYNIVIIPENG